jgi:hypothetical protein
MNPNLSLEMLQMMTSGIVAQSISVAAELGIADHLTRGPRTSAQLATDVAADPDKLHRLLRFLASLGVFEAGADDAWSLTPLAELLRSGVPDSMRAGGQMLGRISAVLPHMIETVRTGKCAYQMAFGKPIFEDLSGNPREAAIFDAAMFAFHGGEVDAVLDAYSYDGIATLADIGCGSGVVMAATLARYPEMRGILFDLPHVIERTTNNLKAAGLDGQCTLHGGNFFDAVPAGADAYAMRHILHDWSDELCVTILSNIRRVMPAAGRLLIVESMIPEGNDPSPAKLLDMIMMLVPDGLERTEAQFRHIFSESGFRLAGVTPTHSAVSVIEARPV